MCFGEEYNSIVLHCESGQISGAFHVMSVSCLAMGRAGGKEKGQRIGSSVSRGGNSGYSEEQPGVTGVRRRVWRTVGKLTEWPFSGSTVLANRVTGWAYPAIGTDEGHPQ